MVGMFLAWHVGKTCTDLQQVRWVALDAVGAMLVYFLLVTIACAMF